MASPIYLDNAATSYPKPEAVYQAVYDYMRLVGASAGRGSYQRALEADEVVYQAIRPSTRLIVVNHASNVTGTSLRT
ncbi:MAG: hypothetical protein D9V47_03605 [Clostridia bacterium]|nr:MAG: hypothetical protein D9V47_03605 [Clostridia bacterium]